MTHEVIRHLLDDYVTGELTEDALAPVAEHVATCAICAGEVESLKGILAQAADLPKSIDPPAEAWLNIRAAIERDKEAVATHQATSESFWRRPYVLAAAIVLAAVLSSGGTALYLNSRNTDLASGRATTRDAANGATPANFVAFTIEENTYLRNVAVLQDLLDQQEGSLAPETVAQLKTSLRTIDEAILEARNALARDPANKMLIEMLSGSYRQKMDLMRRTAEMTRGS
ncbi:MAG TPA: zf-HC2 domain-containing protein [Gemmatimonadaceae bacterium]|jgi:anti-sigma-K factor RskA|nr:zf-HC2 domain-containing protein [Gemmatimonadaceae bacterium]